MAEIDAMGGYTQGYEQKLGLVNKAVDLEKKQADLETQKQQVATQKVELVRSEFDKLGMLPAAQRQKRIEMYSKPMMNAAGINMAPGSFDMIADDEHRVPISDALSLMSEENDPKKRAALANQALGAFSDPATLLSGATQWAAELRQRREIEAMKMRGQQGTAPADIVKLTNETIANLKKSHERQIATIDAVTDINALGSVEDVRSNPVAKDSVKVLLAKMQDPVTGVREGELNRVSGLGAGAYEKVSQYMENFLNGTGKLSEDQWQKVLIVANVLGQKSQKSIDSALVGRQEELARAGVNVSSILNSVSRHTPYDFKGQFGSTPQGINGAGPKPDANALEQKRQEVLKQLRASDPALARMSDQELYQEMNRRSKAQKPRAGGRR